MSEENKAEAPSFNVLQYQVGQLRTDFYALAQTVNKHIEVVLQYMTAETAAKQEREKIDASRKSAAELTWTKVMAMAGVIGAFNVIPFLFHLIH